MGRYDRYILTQLLVLFGFFSLVLVSLYWIEAAVELFDELIADGQNLSVFLEFTTLSLPEIMLLVLPMSSFVATLYVFNRMIGESELVVLQTAGLSAARLLRPVFFFGVILSLLVLVLANVLAPAARERYNDRRTEVGEDVTGRFLREGQFIHPADGLTVYIREITELGEFRDLFLQDGSADDVEVTYTATSALLVRSEGGPRLVMFDGMAQSLNRRTGQLSTVQFADFTYDISALIDDGGSRRLDTREMSTLALIFADEALAEVLRDPLAEVLYEGHDRIGRGLFVMFPPLIAAATLMLGHFSRFGVWRQILVAVGLIIPLQVVWNWAEATATRDETLWGLAYAQAAMAAAITLGLVIFAGMSRRRRSGRMRRGKAVPA